MNICLKTSTNFSRKMKILWVDLKNICLYYDHNPNIILGSDLSDLEGHKRNFTFIEMKTYILEFATEESIIFLF